MNAVELWEQSGDRLQLCGHEIFAVDRAADDDSGSAGPPLLILHGFPTSSFDWRHVLDALAVGRRVVLVDFLGYGLSDKPDAPYSLFEQADIVEALVAQLGLVDVVLVTHDMGDSVGGELLARDLDGDLGFSVAGRVLSNGSIYIADANLTPAQEMLLTMPDQKLPAAAGANSDPFKTTMRTIYGPDTQPTEEELDAQWRLVAREDGNLLTARLIRYIEERRRHEHRWTGALERHAAPLTVVWGDRDPIAGVEMATRLVGEASGARLVILNGIGHYPMVEAPAAFSAAVVEAVGSLPVGEDLA